jgi:hypothetical protein
MRPLRYALRFIGVVQLVLGAGFIAAPYRVASAFGLAPAQPRGVNWLFVMMGGRFIGYGIGMFIAARNPHAHRAWIGTMILIQVIDWIGTLGYLIVGDVTLRNVTTAAVLPPLFIAALLIWHPRRLAGKPDGPSGDRNTRDLTRG